MKVRVSPFFARHQKALTQTKSISLCEAQDFIRNDEGGLEPVNEVQKKHFKELDLITLPRTIQGTACGNCKWYSYQNPSLGFCEHKEVQEYVTKRMCCKEWDRHDVKRAWATGEKSLRGYRTKTQTGPCTPGHNPERDKCTAAEDKPVAIPVGQKIPHGTVVDPDEPVYEAQVTDDPRYRVEVPEVAPSEMPNREEPPQAPEVDRPAEEGKSPQKRSAETRKWKLSEKQVEEEEEFKRNYPEAWKLVEAARAAARENDAKKLVVDGVNVTWSEASKRLRKTYAAAPEREITKEEEEEFLRSAAKDFESVLKDVEQEQVADAVEEVVEGVASLVDEEDKPVEKPSTSRRLPKEEGDKIAKEASEGETGKEKKPGKRDKPITSLKEALGHVAENPTKNEAVWAWFKYLENILPDQLKPAASAIALGTMIPLSIGGFIFIRSLTKELNRRIRGIKTPSQVRFERESGLKATIERLRRQRQEEIDKRRRRWVRLKLRQIREAEKANTPKRPVGRPPKEGYPPDSYEKGLKTKKPKPNWGKRAAIVAGAVGGAALLAGGALVGEHLYTSSRPGYHMTPEQREAGRRRQAELTNPGSRTLPEKSLEVQAKCASGSNAGKPGPCPKLGPSRIATRGKWGKRAAIAAGVVGGTAALGAGAILTARATGALSSKEEVRQAAQGYVQEAPKVVLGEVTAPEVRGPEEKETEAGVPKQVPIEPVSQAPSAENQGSIKPSKFAQDLVSDLFDSDEELETKKAQEPKKTEEPTAPKEAPPVKYPKGYRGGAKRGNPFSGLGGLREPYKKPPKEKAMSAFNSATGGALVPPPAQGTRIPLKRPKVKLLVQRKAVWVDDGSEVPSRPFRQK